jgi:hypothetical protein
LKKESVVWSRKLNNLAKSSNQQLTTLTAQWRKMPEKTWQQTTRKMQAGFKLHKKIMNTLRQLKRGGFE